MIQLLCIDAGRIRLYAANCVAQKDLVEGEVYTADGEPYIEQARVGNHIHRVFVYYIAELGRPLAAARFLPISNIDETELVKERLQYA